MFKLLIEIVSRVKYRSRIFLEQIQWKANPDAKNKLVNNFHKLFYDSQVWHTTSFLGIAIQKCPFDLFIYQEILHELKPDVIIEAGTAFGGGALWLASICDMINHGEVITIDILKQGNPRKHKRITYLIGSSTDEAIIKKVRKLIDGRKKVLVILDSDHTKKHVLNELNLYHEFVTKGSYLIVEDTNVNNNPVYPEHGPGPKEAVDEFLAMNDTFVIDKEREKFFISFNQSGYLKKIY